VSLRLPGQGKSEESDLLVWATLAVALILGIVLQLSVVTATTTASAPGTSLAHPAAWLPDTFANDPIAVVDPTGGRYGDRASVTQRSRTALVGDSLEGLAGAPEQAAATSLSFERGRSLTGYQLLDQRAVTTGDGKPAARVEYVYLDQSAGALAGGLLPGLIRAYDLVVVSGDRVWILTGGTEASRWDAFTQPVFPRLQSTWDGIASSWRVQ
jgi:hypothetical protein